MAPLKIASSLGVQASGLTWVFSFSVGAAIVNLFLLLVYSFCLLLSKKPLPDFQFRVMFLPGSISGLLWATGNFCSIYAVIALGQSIGYPSVQSSMIVSGLWGIIYYRELRGWKPILCWVVAALVALAGIALLSQMKV